MTKRTVEIEDNLDEIIETTIDEVKQLLLDYLNDNPDTSEVPDLYDDLDYSGDIHEIIDGSVPIYTGEIEDLFYLYGNEFEETFDNAGIGDKNNDNWPSGWKAAAIYCYIEKEVADWYYREAEDIFEEWKGEQDV